MGTGIENERSGTQVREQKEEQTTQEEKSEDFLEDKVESDSTDNDSVSKYNFIFYLLYKFKYDDREE